MKTIQEDQLFEEEFDSYSFYKSCYNPRGKRPLPKEANPFVEHRERQREQQHSTHDSPQMVLLQNVFAVLNIKLKLRFLTPSHQSFGVFVQPSPNHSKAKNNSVSKDQGTVVVRVPETNAGSIGRITCCGCFYQARKQTINLLLRQHFDRKGRTDAERWVLVKKDRRSDVCLFEVEKVTNAREVELYLKRIEKEDGREDATTRRIMHLVQEFQDSESGEE